MGQTCGMDPDEMRRLAALLAGQAQRLERIGAEFDSILRVLRWTGPDAEQLRAMWASTGRRSLASAAASLHEAQKRLGSEIGQQESASAAGSASGLAGGSASGSAQGASSAPSSWFERGRAVIKGMKNALDEYGFTASNAVIGVATTLGTHNKFGHYPDLYQKMTRGAEFFKYNKSPSLFNSPLLKQLDDAPVMHGLGKFTEAFAIVDCGSDIIHAFDKNHPGTASEKVEAIGMSVASGLKTSKNPVAYLAGVATASVTQAVSAATTVDWSPKGWQAVCDEVGRNPGALVEELGKAATDVFTKKIWDIAG